MGYTVVGALGLHGNPNHGIETRASNSIQYWTPNMGGLQIKAMWSFGERTAAPTRGGDLMGVSGVYSGGPLTLQAYYQQLKRLDVPGTGTTNNNQYGIGAGYNFGAFRLTASYAVADPSGNANKHSGFSVGAGVKVGVGEILGQVIQQKIATGASTEPKSTTIGVAYVHPLSRRTNVYATFGTTRNNAAGNFALRASDETVAPLATGNDPKAFGVGVRHTF